MDRVAIYARVSTSNGHQSPNMQLRELREFAVARGWQVIGEYVDTGVSGSKASRPQLDRLMTDCKQRRVDVVLVWKLDRWGRSLAHIVTSLQQLQELGVAFVSLKDSFDLTTAAGRLQFQIIAAMAEFERELIRERVRAGLKNARAKGQRLGPPVKFFPQAKVESLIAQGSSVANAARVTGIPRATIIRKLKQQQ